MERTGDESRDLAGAGSALVLDGKPTHIRKIVIGVAELEQLNQVKLMSSGPACAFLSVGLP